MPAFLRLAVPLCALIATPALAAPAYEAQPVTPAAAERLVARDVLWRCGETGCNAAQASNSRPAIICSALVRELGPLTRFAAAGQDFDATALDRCNARAR